VGLEAARSAADLPPVLQPDYPWRPLGRLLVEEGLVAEADLDAALDWARKATAACKLPVEVRPMVDLAEG